MAFGFGRIEFDGNFIDLNRPWTSFQAPRPVSINVNESRDGTEETNKFFSRWLIQARLNLLDPQEKAQLQRLFEFAEDGSSFTLIRDRNLGTYIPFEGGINPIAAPRGLKTNDDVDGTFTRALTTDSAWYLDEGTGLMRVRDVVDQPRFPAGKYSAGIQIDGARTNEIAAPSDFTTGWGGNITKAANTSETLDPAGTSLADKLTATATPDTMQLNPGVAVGNNVAFSIWLKSSTATLAANLRLQGTTGGGPVTKAITITTEWQPFQMTADTSAWTGNVRLEVELPTSGNVAYAWGAQLEDSSQFASDIIGATSVSSITRNAEKLTYLSANIVNRDKGTILMWVKPQFDPTSATGSKDFLESGDSAGANADVHVVFLFINPDRLSLGVRGDNANTLRIDHTPVVSTGMTQNSLHQIGCTYDSTVSNGGHIFVDGAELSSGSSNSAFNISETGDTFAIGSKLDGTNQAFSAIDEILILNKVLTANEIKGIFDLGIGLGVPRNRWTVRLADQTWNPRWLNSDIYDIPLLLKEVLT